MDNEKIEKTQNKNDDSFSTRGIVKAAVALAATTAFFYKTGRIKSLSNKLNKGYMLTKDIQRAYDARLSGDVTLSNVKNFYNDIRASRLKRKDEFEQNPIILDVNSNSNFFGYINSLSNIKNKQLSVANKQFIKKYYINPTRQMFDNSISENIDENSRNRFYNYIRDMSYSLGNFEKMSRIRQKYKFKEENKQALIDIDSFLQKQYNDFDNKKSEVIKQVNNQFDELYNKAFDVDKLEKEFGHKKNTFVETLLDDRAATIEDILKNKSKLRKTNIYHKDNNQTFLDDIIDNVEQLRKNIREQHGEEAEKRFLNITPDKKGLRVNSKNELYSIGIIRNIQNDLLNIGANTLPGKILRLRSFEQRNKAPFFMFYEEGTFDPVLASLTNKNNLTNNKYLDSSYYQLGKDLYKVLGNGSLEEVKLKDDLHLISGIYGTEQKLIRQMMGQTRYKESSNSIFNKLDLFQDREEYSGNIIERFKSIFTKFDNPEWRYNKFNKFFNPTNSQKEELTEQYNKRNIDPFSYNYAIQYTNDYNSLNSFFKENIYDINRKSINELNVQSTEAKDYLQIILNSNDDEIIDNLLTYNAERKNDILNKNLEDIINRIYNDKYSAQQSIKLKTDREGSNLSTSIFDIFNTEPNNETASIVNQLKVEITKEAFLQEAKNTVKNSEQQYDYKSIFNMIEGISDNQEKEYAMQLASHTIFENKTGINISNHDRTSDSLWKEITRVNSILNSSDDETDRIVRENLYNIVKKRVNNLESIPGQGLEDIENPQELPEWIHVGDTVTPIDIINNLNNLTKLKSNTAKSFTQFIAGRDDPENITTLSLVPYFFASRLSDDLNKIGLGFSKDSTGSTHELIANFAFKRILPAAIAGTYLEWADDTSQELTGTSMSGALANSVANVDLTTRKLFDTIGLTDWLKKEKQINPIMQYWGDHNEFMSYDERKEWYESGYEPVRKGAWWTFGGVNEARGSEISYWQPSFARRINSDYKDKSLYDGYFDKWSHSLLPTPSNPFSPIFAILDPYWLEDKHEDDRPYAISGNMFAEGTPWGAILNSTIGEYIKPKIELHPYRLNNGIDLYAMLHQINDYIKNKAQDLSEQNTFSLKGSSIEPVQSVNYNSINNNSSIYSINIHNDGNNHVTITDSTTTVNNNSDSIPQIVNSNNVYLSNGYYNTVNLKPITFNDLDSQADKISFSAYMHNELLGQNNNYYQNNSIVTDSNGNLNVLNFDKQDINEDYYDFSLEDSLRLDKVINGDNSGLKSTLINAIEKINPLDTIKKINENTKKTGLSNNQNIDNNDDNENISEDKLKFYTPSQNMDILNNSYEIAELINAKKGSDFVKDSATSFRLLAGMYGYIANLTTGLGDNTDKTIATSSDINSFSRTFWDMNLGGAGGDVMEIIRRVIPDFKRGTRVNPLMNEMPDWLPERFKFGDPFTLIPKGEMRLPGAGYESLNELHPDLYGDYGAFDRFKILADIAPFTPEFKLWKNIATKTIKDPSLIEEMDEILNRVNQQGKKHDFYDYKVVGKNLNYENIVVSEVLGYGKFKSGDTIYKLAGVRVKGNDQETAQDVLNKYIHVGDIVTIATDQDIITGTNKDKDSTINAAVIDANGQNVANLMLENNDAVKKKGDSSAPAILLNYSPLQKILAYGSEIVAHADIPWLSDQFLRVRSPLESYSAEQVYGTPYQSWSHPINTFLFPAIERAIHEPSIMPKFIYNQLKNTKNIPKKLSDAMFLFGDRGAFIGAALSSLLYPKNGKMIMKGASLSSDILNILRFAHGSNGYTSEIFSGVGLGYNIAKFLEKDTKIGAVIGGLSGLVYRAILGDTNWIPDRTIKKWNTEEYFDRLTYLKYMGLYHIAAEKAKEEEDIDIEKFQKDLEKQEETRRSLSDKLEKIKEALNDTKDSSEKNNLLKLVNSKINALEPQETIVKGGEWTHTALIYKKAAENTVTALKPGASWSQILTALPTNDREYFIEFVKERNPEKRNDILNIVSPQLKKALLISWGKVKDIDDEDIEDENKNFFNNHFLPSEAWVGWRPDIDLKDIKVKTIDNEAMNLSDFGFYESQLRDPNVINATPINMYDSNISNLNNNIKKILEGQGLKDVDVSISTSANGTATQIIANIATFTGLNEISNMINNSF